MQNKLFVTHSILLIFCTCFVIPAQARTEFELEDKGANFKLVGYFEENIMYIKYQIQQSLAPKSILFIWRLKEPLNIPITQKQRNDARGSMPFTGNCPGFGILFDGRTLNRRLKSHVTIACEPGEGHDPEIKFELAGDFKKRIVDKLENDTQYFEGIMEYPVSLEKYSISKLNQMYIRGQGLKTEIFFERFYDLRQEAAASENSSTNDPDTCKPITTTTNF